jgi:integrase
MALTDTQIKRHLDTPQTIRDSKALFLRVGDKGASWVCRQTRNGKTSKVVLGHYPDMSANMARRERDRLTGVNTDLAVTVAEAVGDYRRLVTDKLKSGDQSEVYLRHICEVFGTRKLATITRANLVQLVSRYASDRGPRSADRLLSQLRGLFNLAVEMGHLEQSPLMGVTKRITGYEMVHRERVLTDDEIRTVWAMEGYHGPLLRFLLLTGLRISEAQKGHREDDKWIVPAKYSKNKRPHWVHLTDTAIEQLAAGFETSPTAVQSWIKRRELGWTPHDLRRTASTRMAGNGVNPFTVERCLGHTLQGVMAVYNRAEYEAERIAATETLERVLLEVSNG